MSAGAGVCSRGVFDVPTNVCCLHGTVALKRCTKLTLLPCLLRCAAYPQAAAMTTIGIAYLFATDFDIHSSFTAASLSFSNGCTPPSPPLLWSMDVCFMLDATASMADCIEEMKNKVVAMARIMQEKYTALTMRVACIGALSVDTSSGLLYRVNM